jgi:hypothetical protein
MDCPVCGLINPPDSSRCDCGYDFSKRTGGARPPFRIRHRGAFFGVIFLTALLTAWVVIEGTKSTLSAVFLALVITPHIAFGIAWTVWGRAPFSPTEEPGVVGIWPLVPREKLQSPRLRTMVLFLGLLAGTLHIAIFWAWVAWMNFHRSYPSLWKIHDQVEEAGDLLIVLVLSAVVFGEVEHGFRLSSLL